MRLVYMSLTIYYSLSEPWHRITIYDAVLYLMHKEGYLMDRI